MVVVVVVVVAAAAAAAVVVVVVVAVAVAAKATLHTQRSVQRFTFAGSLEFSVGQWVVQGVSKRALQV